MKKNPFIESQSVVKLQKKMIRDWHNKIADENTISKKTGLSGALQKNGFYNFNLWHTEDEARRKDVPDSTIAEVKRKIDRFNQLRNNAIEEIDASLINFLQTQKGYKKGRRLNSETPGSIYDRLFIIALRIYHMNEETQRKDAPEDHIKKCTEKLRILEMQRDHLAKSLDDLFKEYLKGKKSLLVYFQMKMYNDPTLNPALYKKNAQ